MSMQTFERALEFALFSDQAIFIGGGEPTIHPLFYKFLEKAIGFAAIHEFEMKVGMVTNGSKTDIALKLARLTKYDVINCDLSLDQFHDPIDPKVVQAFKAMEFHLRGQSNNFRIMNHGRGKKISYVEKIDGCPCSELFIKPNGNVYQCGCKNAELLCNVNEDFSNLIFDYGRCYNEENED